MIPLDEMLRPKWLFGETVHEGCDRGGRYEQAEFAEEYGPAASSSWDVGGLSCSAMCPSGAG